MARGSSLRASEVQITGGPWAGLVSEAVSRKIESERKRLGDDYEKQVKMHKSWPSALTREVELRRTLAVDPNAVFHNEKDDPKFLRNEKGMLEAIDGLPIEMGVLYDKYNRLISITQGEAAHVEFHALNDQMKDGTTLHNHPMGGPVSYGDVGAHIAYGSAYTKVVSPEGVYSLSGKTDTSRVVMMLEVQEAAEQAMAMAMGPAYMAAKVTKAEVGKLNKLKDAGLASLQKAVPYEKAIKIDASINKAAYLATKKVVEAHGFKLEFTPNEKYLKKAGYATFDEIPAGRISV